MVSIVKKVKVKWKNVLRILIILLALVGIIYSLYHIFFWHKENEENKKVEETINEYVTIDEQKEEYEVNFDELSKINPDTIGYIYIPNSGISFVVVKGKNNSYYLNHNFEKEKNQGGWIFMDYSNTGEITDKNIVIYGHNRFNGSMFAPLKTIMGKDWYKNESNHTLIYVNRNGIHKYKVFSQYTIEAEDYYITTSFDNDESFKEFVSTVKKRSQNKYDLDIDSVKSVITLSTCTNIGDGRIALHAALIEE